MVYWLLISLRWVCLCVRPLPVQCPVGSQAMGGNSTEQQPKKEAALSNPPLPAGVSFSCLVALGGHVTSSQASCSTATLPNGFHARHAIWIWAQHKGCAVQNCALSNWWRRLQWWDYFSSTVEHSKLGEKGKKGSLRVWELFAHYVLICYALCSPCVLIVFSSLTSPSLPVLCERVQRSDSGTKRNQKCPWLPITTGQIPHWPIAGSLGYGSFTFAAITPVQRKSNREIYCFTS